MTSIIELNNISKHYGSVVAVDQVNLSVKNGDFLTLLGPSGCGKSTLLRMIGGFELPTSGSISLDGEDVTYVPPQQRDVNMMFQDYALFPHMRVGDNIAYGLKRKGIKGKEARQKAVEALELVGLPDKIDQHPHQLSGGQKQRVALARAIVRQPKVLLLDEPLSALDANMREQMQVELKHMHEKLGITFIMVTHDQTEALVMSDRVIVMEEGGIAQDGKPEDLYERPATPYVANFIGTTNFLNAKLVEKNGKSITLSVAGFEVNLPPDTDHQKGDDVRIGIRPEKTKLVQANGHKQPNSLTGTVEETIYLGLSMRTVVRMDDGTTIRVDRMLEKNSSNSDQPQMGDQVSVVIDPSSALLFERENLQ